MGATRQTNNIEYANQCELFDKENALEKLDELVDHEIEKHTELATKIKENVDAWKKRREHYLRRESKISAPEIVDENSSKGNTSNDPSTGKDFKPKVLDSNPKTKDERKESDVMKVIAAWRGKKRQKTKSDNQNQGHDIEMECIKSDK